MDLPVLVQPLGNELSLYNFQQINGQRILGPPRDWDKPVPDHGSEIYVTGFPRYYHEHHLLQLFSCVGKVFQLRLMMDFSGFNRGYCYITYENPSVAIDAVKKLNKFRIPGHYNEINAFKSVDNRRIFIKYIPRDKSPQEILFALQLAFDGVVTAYVPLENDGKQNRGIAFAEFESHRLALLARKKAHPNNLVLWQNVVYVDWAMPKNLKFRKQFTQIYIGNVSPEITTKTIVLMITKITNENKIVSVVRKPNYLFVQFLCVKSAKKAIYMLRGTVLNEKMLRVGWATGNNSNLESAPDA